MENSKTMSVKLGISNFMKQKTFLFLMSRCKTMSFTLDVCILPMLNMFTIVTKVMMSRCSPAPGELFSL